MMSAGDKWVYFFVVPCFGGFNRKPKWKPKPFWWVQPQKRTCRARLEVDVRFSPDVRSMSNLAVLLERTGRGEEARPGIGCVGFRVGTPFWLVLKGQQKENYHFRGPLQKRHPNGSGN